MGIEFLVDLDCPVKARAPSEELSRLLRDKGRLDAALEGLAEDADLSRHLVKILRVDGEGGERVETLPLEAFRAGVEARAAAVADLAHHCARCRARVVAHEYGCYGRIDYPIEPETEEMFVDRLPPLLGTVGGAFLVRAIGELGFDGEKVARMRAEGRTFFTRERPMTQRWSDGSGSFTVTTDQLFHIAFFARDPRPAHALLVALVFGVVPHGVGPEDLAPLLADRAALEGLLEPSLVPRALEGTQTAAALRFFEAVRRAVLLDCPLRVDA